MAQTSYLPALRFRFLTRVYDPVVRWTTREGTFKPQLVDQTQLQPGHRVLDLGCGTGTLALMVKRIEPASEVTGLDADREMLSQAEDKARSAGVALQLDEGRSDELPYEDESFDRVLATLFFHHLSDEVKRRTIAEIVRVLKPEGELHVADWGRPQDPLMRFASWQIRLLDGLEPTEAVLAGELPAFFEAGGLAGAAETQRLRTALGILSLYRAACPADGPAPT
jgi:ubiquinone/menaquinone biosynthesis C-methylase UbiE